MIVIAPLIPADRAPWQALSRGYHEFYETDLPPEVYERTWTGLLANESLHGLGARLDGALVGIAHYLFHGNVWHGEVCYLQDLFVGQAARGHGAARALIDAVADAARRRGAARFYWQTKHDNARARALYDKVATFRGFIRYDFPLD